MQKIRPFCLSIAGFDPSGGAGILADIKTFEKIKVQGLAVLTSDTIQTEDTFLAVKWKEPVEILRQLETLIKAYQLKFIKIGLIENADSLLLVLQSIRKHNPKCNIIWDPIIAPTAENQMDKSRFDEKIDEILKNIDFITPNINEYHQIFGKRDASQVSSETGTGIILKGGHSAEQKGKDLFYYQGKTFSLNPKIQTAYAKHGSGCILSSAFTAYLATGHKPLKALVRAKDFVEKRIVSNKGLLSYY